MCGRGVTTEPRLDYADSDVFQYGFTTYDGITTWANLISQAIDPLSFPETHASSTGPSPLTTFARNYARQLAPNRKVLLIPAAIGGTGLTVPGGTTGYQWSVGFTPSDHSLYVRTVAQVAAAITAAGAGTHRVVAWLWVQGEQDGDQSVAANTYRTALDALITALPTDLATAGLPFIVGQLVPDFLDWVGSPTRRAINDVHVDTPRRKVNTAFAYGPPGVTNELGDNNHYSAAGLRTLGASMWAAYARAKANVFGVAPVAPSAPPTIVQSGTVLAVAWLQSAGRVTDYSVQYRKDGGSWTTLTRSQSIDVTASITGITLGSTYDVQIASVNEQGTSTWSATGTIAAASIPAVPTGLTAGTATLSTQPLTWSAVTGATSYLVEYKAHSSGTWLTGPTVTGLAATVTGLSYSTSYDYRVTAINAAGSGSTSSTTTATTATPTALATDVGVTPFFAYGLRKLVAGYAGSAIKVRRSSDSTEQDIGFTVGGDLDQSALTTFCGAGDGFVSKWYDQSGNTRDLAQSTTGSQPQIVTSGVIETQGGKPCVKFASNRHVFRSAAGLYDAGAATIMRVEQVNASVGVVFAESHSTGQNGRYIPIFQNTSSYSWPITTDAAVALANITSIPGTFDAAIHQLSAWDDGSHLAFWQDGVSKLASTPYTRSGTVTLDRSAIGTWLTPGVTSSYTGKVSEVVAWGVALTTGQRQAGEANQKAYFGTP